MSGRSALGRTPTSVPRHQSRRWHAVRKHRALPDQLLDPFLRAGVHSLVGKTVIFLTFFTNIVLMACFLGVSVGCLAASRKWSWINALVPLALLTVGLGVRIPVGLQYFQPGDGRRRFAAVASTDLLRH